MCQKSLFFWQLLYRWYKWCTMQGHLWLWRILLSFRTISIMCTAGEEVDYKVHMNAQMFYCWSSCWYLLVLLFCTALSIPSEQLKPSWGRCNRLRKILHWTQCLQHHLAPVATAVSTPSRSQFQVGGADTGPISLQITTLGDGDGISSRLCRKFPEYFCVNKQISLRTQGACRIWNIVQMEYDRLKVQVTDKVLKGSALMMTYL